MKSNVVSLNSYKMNYQVGGDDSIADILNICEANFKKGLKNMAISSTHYHSLQQKLILSALQFFNLKYPHKKICTISFSCDSGNFQEFSAHATATKQAGVSSFGGQFDLISWQHLIENKIEKKFLYFGNYLKLKSWLPCQKSYKKPWPRLNLYSLFLIV